MTNIQKTEKLVVALKSEDAYYPNRNPNSSTISILEALIAEAKAAGLS